MLDGDGERERKEESERARQRERMNVKESRIHKIVTNVFSQTNRKFRIYSTANESQAIASGKKENGDCGKGSIAISIASDIVTATT